MNTPRISDLLLVHFAAQQLMAAEEYLLQIKSLGRITYFASITSNYVQQ
jgi:hypothetical protein